MSNPLNNVLRFKESNKINCKWQPFWTPYWISEGAQGGFSGTLCYSLYSTHIPGSILKNSACYELFPPLGVILTNALGLCIFGPLSNKNMARPRPGPARPLWTVGHSFSELRIGQKLWMCNISCSIATM